jgi:NitT/TauT family transport system substrate-binding protein
MDARPVRPITRRRLLAAAPVAVAAVLAACSAGPSPVGADSAPEQPHLRLGVLPIVDDAHLLRAQAAGYFAAEGLTVDLITVQGGAAALPRLTGGDLDLTFTNYVSVLLAQAQGGDFRFVDGGYEAGRNTLLIMTKPGSAVRSPQDLAGRKIAVNTRRNIVELTARSALETAGVDPATVTFVEVPFPDMAATLRDDKVAAAYMVEPFITQAALSFGAVSALDAGSGATEGIPIGGVAVTAAFAAKNLRTVAAFRRAVARAQADMTDRSVVEKTLPTYTKINPDTAALIALGSWPAALDRVRLQRDVDLMRQYGVLTTDLDAGRMVLPPG